MSSDRQSETAPAGDGARSAAPRLRLPLNGDWDFQRGRPKRRWLDGAEGGGESVTPPHCWNAGEEFQVGRGYYRGPAAYRVAFDLPAVAAPGRWRLRSGGFYGTGRLRLNGRDAGAFSGDYLGFDMELGAGLRQGTNLLGCVLTNRCARHVLPGIAEPDFLLYGGLAGAVWLEFVPELHWDENELHVSCRDMADGDVEASITAHLVNDGALARRVAFAWEVRAPLLPGHPVRALLRAAAETAVAARTTVACRLALRLPRAARWRPETPWLYESRLTACAEDGAQDHLERAFGVRRLECRPGQGFFCDGGRIELRGCNRHEQVPGFGNALPAALHRLDAQAIRAAGLNFVRLSHYPQASEFLDACDQTGIWVMPELASWKSVRGGRWLRQAERQLARLVRRDRHHPCVLLWCLGNESRHRRAYMRLDALARGLDPEERPTIYAENHIHRARRSRTLGLTDVWGVNYELGAIAEGREAARRHCVLVTECANAPYAQRGDRAAEVQQRAQLAEDLELAAGADGFAVWSFNDYATQRKQRFMRYSGILDGWREPKLAARWLAARADERPVLGVWCDWSVSGAPSRAISLVTNCEKVARVTLSVWPPPPRGQNGAERYAVHEPLLVTPARMFFHEMTIPFDGQPLRLCGTWRGQRVVCCVDPWETAADLRLSLETIETDAAGGERVATLVVQIVDGEGRAVRNYSGEAEVRLSGRARAALLGGRLLPVRNGTARLFVAQSAKQAGPLHVQLAVSGLRTRSFPLLWEGAE